MKDNDEAAAAAWTDRVRAMRQGCEAAIVALERDGKLSAGRSREDAIDSLSKTLSVRTREELTIECGWLQQKYVGTIKALAKRLLVAD